MKTKALSASTIPSKFKDQLSVFEQVDDGQVNFIVDWLFTLRNIASFSLDENALLYLSEKTSLAADKIYSLITTLVYSRMELAEFNDTADDFVDDLLGEKLLSDLASKKFRKGLLRLANKNVLKLEISKAFNRLFPTYLASRIKPIALPVVEKECGAQDDAKAYKPAISTTVFSLLMNIKISGTSDLENFNLVLDEEDVEELSRNLEIARKELATFKSALGQKG